MDFAVRTAYGKYVVSFRTELWSLGFVSCVLIMSLMSQKQLPVIPVKY
jgi:hypothetical protein